MRKSPLEVQIRYRAQAATCVIRPLAEGRCEVRFDNPLAAVTPGQAAVFYRGAQVLGGGWIERAVRLREARFQNTNSKLQIPGPEDYGIWNLTK